jgi:hypothetical protein
MRLVVRGKHGIAPARINLAGARGRNPPTWVVIPRTSVCGRAGLRLSAEQDAWRRIKPAPSRRRAPARPPTSPAVRDRPSG